VGYEERNEGRGREDQSTLEQAGPLVRLHFAGEEKGIAPPVGGGFPAAGMKDAQTEAEPLLHVHTETGG
jgi:hypothetical protein